MDANKAVKSFAPILIHGELDCGEAVSLLWSQKHSAGPSAPVYKARASVYGALVHPSQLYDSIRFQIVDPCWTRHLNRENLALTADASKVRTVPFEDGVWIHYESALPLSIRDLQHYVANACITLMHLAFDFRPTIREIQLKVGEGPWLRTSGPGYRGSISGWDHPMLEPAELSIERIAKWFDLNASLDGLGAAIVEPPSGAVQAQALVATTILEGVHRRLPFEQSRFPALRKAVKKKILKAARSAAAAAAEEQNNPDAGEIVKSIADSLSRFDSVSYLDRARDITDEVAEAVPELTSIVPDLPKVLREARDNLAHHLVERDSIDEMIEVLEQWIIAKMAAPWLLRFLLLLRVGIEPHVLRQKALEHQRFEFVLANIANIVGD